MGTYLLLNQFTPDALNGVAAMKIRVAHIINLTDPDDPTVDRWALSAAVGYPGTPDEWNNETTETRAKYLANAHDRLNSEARLYKALAETM